MSLHYPLRSSLVALATIISPLACTCLFASSTAATYPIVASQDGMTVTITDASWVAARPVPGRIGQKALQIHFSVKGDSTVPFSIGSNNTIGSFYRPNGDNIGYLPTEDGTEINESVSPTWPSEHLVFRATDPKAPEEATDGYCIQTVHWSNIRLPAQNDIPTPIGISQSTIHGTVVTLDRILVSSSTPITSGKPMTVLVFRVTSGHAIPDLKSGISGGRSHPAISVTDSAGHSLVESSESYMPQYYDTLTGSPGYVSYQLPIAVDDSRTTPINISVEVREYSKSFQDPRTTRNVAVDIPLAGLPGLDPNGPEQILAQDQSGSVKATLENQWFDRFGQFHSLVWLSSSLGVTYRVASWQFSAEPGGAPIAAPGSPFMDAREWKANGAAPQPGEVADDIGCRLTNGIPAGASSVSLAITAIADRHLRYRFAYTKLPCPTPGQAEQVDFTSPDTALTDSSAKSAESGPVVMTITRIRCVPNTSVFQKQFPSKNLLNIYFRIDGVAYKPAPRLAMLNSIVDDKGRVIEVKFSSTSSDPGNEDDCLTVLAPEADATTFDMDLNIDDSVQQAPPMHLTFRDLPTPVAPAKSQPLP